MEELFGKERRDVFPRCEQQISSCCSALDAFSGGCAVIVQARASREMTLESSSTWPVSNTAETCYQSLFLEGLL